MKWIGAIMVLISSTGIGFLYADELKKRKTELSELLACMKLILGDIRYTKAALPEAIKAAGKRHKGSFSGFLRAVSEQIEQSPGIPLATLWEEAAKRNLQQNSLSKQDKDVFFHFGEAIGFADREQQLGAFELYIHQLEEEIEKINEVIIPKTKLYRSIGVLIGIFIIVVLV